MGGTGAGGFGPGASGTIGLFDEPDDPGPPCVRALAADVNAMAVVTFPPEETAREEVGRIPCEREESDETCLARASREPEAEGDDRDVEIAGEAGGVTATVLVDDEEMVRIFPSTQLLVSFMQAEANRGRRVVLQSMEEAYEPGTRVAVIRRVRTLMADERHPRALIIVRGDATVVEPVEAAAQAHGVVVEEVTPMGEVVHVRVECR